MTLAMRLAWWLARRLDDDAKKAERNGWVIAAAAAGADALRVALKAEKPTATEVTAGISEY